MFSNKVGRGDHAWQPCATIQAWSPKLKSGTLSNDPDEATRDSCSCRITFILESSNIVRSKPGRSDSSGCQVLGHL